MESTQKSVKTTHYSKKLKILLPIVVLVILTGTVSAAVFTMFSTQNTATVKTPDIQFVAGPDSGGATYPFASVAVASTHDYANIGFSLFPSAANTPQPATYYTNLLQIHNAGNVSHTIQSVTISGISGATNLGSITIYYYAAQTDTPASGTPIGSATLTSTSTGTVTIFSGSQALAASGTQYIEIVGYAGSSATVSSTIGFTMSVQWN
jgi:hypothetical protein